MGVRRLQFVFSLVPVIAMISTSMADEITTSDDVDFSRDIRPLLSQNCFRCHGPDAAARQADLRLDVQDVLVQPLPDGTRAIVPGDASASAMFQRMTTAHDDDRMPPADSGLSLTAEEIELVRRWIDQGATWERHWSFIPASRSFPGTSDEGVDPIDRHVREALQAAGLESSPAADRTTRLRRITFDLTGLPPAIEEIDAFLADDEPGAWGRVIDRLLESEAYGEHMAAAWLDLARYADTYGYQTDRNRAVWPYRDWVIRSFNDNLPYDQFVTWQLAGDLLPDPTRDQQLATAFNRLHRQTNEGGSVEEEYRVEYVADRVHTYGTAMLGMTTECARCHDHKFDPISQREYYELFAFFDDINECGLYSHFTNAVPTPTLMLATPEQEERIAAARASVTAAEMGLSSLREQRRPSFESWRNGNASVADIPGLVGHYPMDAIEDNTLVNHADSATPGTVTGEPELVESMHGMGLLLSGENNARFPTVAAFTRSDPFTLSLWIKVPGWTDRAVILHRSRSWTDAGSQGYQLLIEDGHPTWSLVHFWPGNAISIRGTTPLDLNRWMQITLVSDGSSRADGLSMFIDGEVVDVEIEQDHLTKPITGGGPGAMTIGQRFRDRGFKHGQVDDLRVFNRALTPVEARQLFDERALADAVVAGTEEAFDYYLATHDQEWMEAREAVQVARRELAGALDQPTEIMTMVELEEPRVSHVLDRGRYDARLEAVEPDTPASIMSFPEELPRNRLGLARWTLDRENPLAARVAVNRLWAVLFNTGIVATPEDFGNQGLLPSHPELLDELALDFIDSGWDVKAMLKRMAMSETYQQSSRASEAHRRIDPQNRLLARGPSGRLSAEMIRDHALATSGLLVQRVGGPSVYPYQPAGLWQEKSGSVYPQGTGDSLYRRSLYTFWKLTSPPPSMMIFDAAKRDVCLARRQTTSTPLQALVLLNDPQFVEAARILAERVEQEAGPSTTDRITMAWRLLTSRPPTSNERDVLLALHERERQVLAEDLDAARAILAIPDGESLDDAAARAALVIVCSTMMNADAAVMRR
ncbi:MAG: DUF1553 domain-containing protein [Phycisphaerales bacterium]|nr:DUF1553 domain-containing protein [Phycisphaerales bacterium]